MTFQRYVRCVVDGKRAQEKFLNRPNLHALLHLKGTARDFGSLRNVGGAVGEAKHKPFKAQAMLSNFRDVDKAMLFRTSVYQSMRMIIDGSYDIDKPWISDAFKILLGHAPLLFGSAAPVSQLQRHRTSHSKKSSSNWT